MENKDPHPLHSYLGITIGPVYKTIRHARKTRELWAASFALSQFMKNILSALQNEGICLSPDIKDGKLNKTFHGAGIWNDNCFFRIHDDKAETLQKELNNLLRNARAETVGLLLQPNKDGSPYQPIADIAEMLASCWHYHAVWIRRDDQNEGAVLKELQDLLRAPEQLAAFSPKNDDLLGQALSREETIRKLYSIGFSDADIEKIFTRYGKNRKHKRLPSLLEIAGREIRRFETEDNPFYRDTVTAAITEALRERIKSENARKNQTVEAAPEPELNDHLAEDNKEDNQIIANLKAELAKLKIPFKKRWKYVAVVQSDGDNVGKTIGSLKNRQEIEDFSEELMAFSIAAAGIIADFGGVPVFAGGDDLLFVAPLQNERDETLFDLIDRIDAAFKNQPFLVSQGASLSFGASIAYYKSPMSESLDESHELLQQTAKKLSITARDNQTQVSKNALAFRVLTNSGMAFGAALRLGTPAYLKWTEMLRHKSDLQGDNAFTSSLMHKLEPLRALLEDACAHEQAEFFFLQHFNEARGARKKFLDHAREFAEKAYGEYGSLLFKSKRECLQFYEKQLDENLIKAITKQTENQASIPAELTGELESRYKINLLYAALRTIHFLNADDHE